MIDIETSPLTAPYWAALEQGRLTFQRCACAHAWLPPRENCPRCLASDWRWETASGAARLISWVVYHTAYHPAFADKLPYNVAIVELTEGPRLITNIRADHATLAIGMTLRLTPERAGPVTLARFAPSG
jgi:uncharacterized OB-fold protein